MALRLSAVLLLAAGSSPLAVAETELSGAELAFFEKRIRPVLATRCYECHSVESKVKAGLRLDTRDGLLAGGDSGPAIVPGKPEESLLITAVRHIDEDLRMPEKEKLPDRDIDALTRWVAMGAPDPRTGSDSPADHERPAIDYEAGRAFWAFAPPVRRSAPEAQDSSWPRTDIDRHLLAAMEERGLAPVADADRRTLVRRLYFDLVGLPPTPAQIRSFLEDDSPRAVENLVDALLASPRFGERWGRHWLDVARYSESNGMERNFTYPHAWRYRDYVIDSFNQDKPYDQFIREQIAGDLLAGHETPGTGPDERLIATGFLALGPKILNERDKEVFRMELVDEQIDATTRAVLALTVSCARCHDHKFDPVSMEDYYALAGIFTSTRTLYGTTGGGGNRQGSDLIAIGEKSSQRQRQFDEHENTLKESQKQLSQVTRQFQKLRSQVQKLKEESPKNRALQKRVAETRKRMDGLKEEIAALRKNAPPPPDYAMGVADAASPADCRLRLRGDPKKHGSAVPRGFLRVLATSGAPDLDKDDSGRRQLADWLTSCENPLTARVMVNRVWHHLHGTGLVRTVDNFGRMGERPVNPGLLDHLAIHFMDNGWSVKSLIREIVLSRSYQLSSRHHQGNYAIDPENRSCWRMNRRRLSAEAIRDAILHAGGALETAPFEGSVVQKLGDVNYGRNNGDLADESGAVARHRSVYLPIIRNAVPETLRVFDFAESSLIVGRRDVTTVPTQALYFLNDPFVLLQSERLAQRLLDEAPNDEARVDLATHLTLGRPASTLERQRALALVREIHDGLDPNTKRPERDRHAWAAFAQALLATAEFRYLD